MSVRCFRPVSVWLVGWGTSDIHSPRFDGCCCIYSGAFREAGLASVIRYVQDNVESPEVASACVVCRLLTLRG